ncbi:hypothetical protein [Streptomyces sp. H39-S7]|uniref:hypothetical protein n=1 Tax=Streptomyces sp. H39-S7 TaxID=3004357 RepID=UPI0022AEE6B0|nr:hypothetical protein [Streptomyces sp. H39-S7]MCZ4124602.1 hypothetical protein [Streptomyces sp. H39-S7]
MNTRRIALTLAGIAAATFLASGTASAHGHDNGDSAGRETASGNFSYANRGGPFGITYAHAGFAHGSSYVGGHDKRDYAGEASSAAASYANRGGPYGITRAHGEFMMVSEHSGDSDH